MNLVPFVEQKLGQVRTVLTGDSGNQCLLWSKFGGVSPLIVDPDLELSFSDAIVV